MIYYTCGKLFGVQYKKVLINCLHSPLGEKVLRLWTGEIQWTKLIKPILSISFTVKLFLQSCAVKLCWKRLLYIILLPGPHDNIYNEGLLRAGRTHPSVGLYDESLLRSLRLASTAPAPVEPKKEDLLRSLRSGPDDHVYTKAILRSARSGRRSYQY